jgi:hypothetical protein
MGMGPAVLRSDDLRAGVLPALVGANRFADVPLYITKKLTRQDKHSFILVTILKMSAFRAGPVK